MEEKIVLLDKYEVRHALRLGKLETEPCRNCGHQSFNGHDVPVQLVRSNTSKRRSKCYRVYKVFCRRCGHEFFVKLKGI